MRHLKIEIIFLLVFTEAYKIFAWYFILSVPNDFHCLQAQLLVFYQISSASVPIMSLVSETNDK